MKTIGGRKMKTTGSWKPKHKIRFCVVCQKPYEYRENVKHKADFHIVRGKNMKTCSKKCSRLYNRVFGHILYKDRKKETQIFIKIIDECSIPLGDLYDNDKIDKWIKDNRVKYFRVLDFEEFKQKLWKRKNKGGIKEGEKRDSAKT